MIPPFPLSLFKWVLEVNSQSSSRLWLALELLIFIFTHRHLLSRLFYVFSAHFTGSESVITWVSCHCLSNTHCLLILKFLSTQVNQYKITSQLYSSLSWDRDPFQFLQYFAVSVSSSLLPHSFYLSNTSFLILNPILSTH